MGALDSHRSGAKRIHVLVEDPLKMGRNVMFEKTRENILGGGGAVSSALVSDEEVACVSDSDSARALEFPTVHGGSESIETASNTGCFEEDEAVNEAAERLNTRYLYRFFKRLFDVLFSLFVLIAFSWLFLIIAIAIKIDDPKGPVFFKQKRVGKDGREFQMYKFRSMCVDAESRLEELKSLNEKTGPVFKMSNDPRVMRVGHWLRKLSLDELPQFVNVLKNDLSVVGPRPALPSEVAEYTPRQRQRLLCKQGLTCYWQTRRNRDSIGFDEWVELDLLYIRQCSAWADFKLIVQTVGCVLTAQGN